MTTFAIDADNTIGAFPTRNLAQAALDAGAQAFASEPELAELTSGWPIARLVSTWNGFAGTVPFDKLKPVKKFTDRGIAIRRIWQAIQKLAPVPQTGAAAKTGATGAPPEVAANRPAASAPRPPKAPKTAPKGKAKAAAKSGRRKLATPEPREGSKKAKVLALLGRPKGATLSELMKATGWQAHSVRGFISGALGTKMGLTVESAKREDGERVYSIRH